MTNEADCLNFILLCFFSFPSFVYENCASVILDFFAYIPNKIITIVFIDFFIIGEGAVLF